MVVHLGMTMSPHVKRLRLRVSKSLSLLRYATDQKVQQPTVSICMEYDLNLPVAASIMVESDICLCQTYIMSPEIKQFCDGFMVD